MANIKADEISKILREEIENYEQTVSVDEVGAIISVGDGIARIHGLEKVMAGEMLAFPHNIFGIALNLEEEQVGAVLLGESAELKEGDVVKRTNTIMSVPVGDALIGRVVNPIGEAVDDKGPISTKELNPLERIAPGVLERQPVTFYEDLSKHAQAYREISLLLRRPPGREAYPGDVFYLHSRLLERAAKLNDKLGGGSLTSLPVIETQAGDVSAYIPTNVISITDGQIYLEADLFNAGIRPAINVGISVSRVGGNAQIKAMRQVAGSLRLDMAQYRDLAAFAQFGSDQLDKATQAQLARGQRLQEILKQDQYAPLPVEKQVLILYVATSGQIDSVPVSEVRRFERELLQFVEVNHPSILKAIREKKALDDGIKAEIKKAVDAFKERFTAAVAVGAAESSENFLTALSES